MSGHPLAATRLTVVLASLTAGVAIAGCAAAAPFNPAHLDEGRLDRVARICQSAVGLQPDEPPAIGNDNPRLADPQENRYQGCIASLSRFADAPTALRLTRVSADAHTVKPGSFYWATTGEQSRRIANACAALGLDPAAGAVASCVKEMRDTFYAIANPWR
jgi:hypothetical protein